MLSAGLLVAGAVGPADGATTGPTGPSRPTELAPPPQAPPAEGLAAARTAELAARQESGGGAITPRTARRAAAPTSYGSLFTSLAPRRILDTRTTIGGAPGQVGWGQTIHIDLSGAVPASATAVVLNLTAADGTLATYVTVWPDGDDRPTSSNLNVTAGEVRSNAVTVPLGAARRLSLYNFHGSVDLIADLAGYYAPDTGAGYTSISPKRVLDTRPWSVQPNQTIQLDLSGVVPTNTTAVTLNLTGVSATKYTYLTAWPDGTAQPVASSLNVAPGAVTPNLVTVALPADRKLDLYNFQGTVALVADLAGYYTTGGGSAFYQLLPDRVLDTRYSSPLSPDEEASVNLAAWLPKVSPNATAAVFNLTGTDTTATTYLTAFPPGQNPPTASNLNLAPGQTSSNLVTVGLGSNSVWLYNFQGNVDIVMDLAGYFAPPVPVCTVRCVYSWGDNNFGQLGNGTTGGWSGTPTPVPGLTSIRQVASGALDGYAVNNAGPVQAWGYNGDGELGDGADYGLAPMPSSWSGSGGISAVDSIAISAYTGYAVNGGHVYAWGYGADGELGDDITFAGSPVQVSGVSGTVTSVAAAYATGYALTSDGSVWAWGTNGGSLGNGTYGTGCANSPVGAGCRSTPIRVPGLTGVTAVSAGWNDTFAITSDGSVWGWGWNAEGELGVPAPANGKPCYATPTLAGCVVLSPTRIPGLSGVTSLAEGVASTYALKSDGTVLAFGWNANGELGAGTAGGVSCASDENAANCYSSTPVAVTGLTGVTQLAAGQDFGLARTSDGSVWSWGDDSFGQLGAAQSVDVPTKVAGLANITTIGASAHEAFASADTP